MSKFHRTLWFMSVLMILALVLAACPAPVAPTAPAGDSAATPAAEGEAAAEAPAAAADLQIGLVTDVGRVNDRSFNQSAWQGVQNAAATLGLPEESIKYIETMDAKDYADNMQQFIDNDYDVIVTVGFALGEATIAAAQENPDIFFIGVDQVQPETLPNLTGLVFYEDQSGFLAGALAAHLTESGTIAAVLGTDLVPPVVAYKEGYEAGARYINPDINIISTYHPGELSQAFVDPEWGAATAKQAIDQGADVIFGAGGQTGNGALQEVATQEGLYCIGVDTDQWETLPAAHPCLVSSAIKPITSGVEVLIAAVADGSFPGGEYREAGGLAPFHDFEEEIPQEVKDDLARIDAGLKDGSITTGYGQ
jgi:basic membrane protein A